MINRVVALFFTLCLLNSCAATLPSDFQRVPSAAYTDTRTTLLAQSIQSEVADHPGESGFHLLDNGLDAFVARVVLAQAAQRSLDVQYYLFHDDLVGRLFADQLVKAADRGVRVRLLVDDMNMKDKDLSAVALATHPNIEVRIFNPFSRKASRLSQLVTRYGSVTRRMHNKSFTADNQISILGGRNIGDEYFDASPDLAFADLDVMIIGPAVEDISLSFDRYWNSEHSYPAGVLAGESLTSERYEKNRKQLDEFVIGQSDSQYIHALRNSSLAEKLRSRTVAYYWGNARIVYDLPEKITSSIDQTEYYLVPQLEPYFQDLKKELIVFSPYFVPGKAGTAFLTGLAAKGVKVRILTNSLASNDVGIVHSGYARYRRKLLRRGVELYELNKKAGRQKKSKKFGASKASLHAKSFVFDRQEIFIGSLNLDPRSVVHNTEIGVLFSAEKIGEAMSRAFDQMVKENAFRLLLIRDSNGRERLRWHGKVDGNPVTFKVDPYTSFWKRLGTDLLRLLPIESQL